MRHHHRCDPHDCPITGGVLRGLPPRPTIAEGLTRRGYSAPNTENAAISEHREQPLRDNPIVLKQMLKRPKCELSVVRWEPNSTTAGVSIGLIVKNGASRGRELSFSRVPK